MGHQHVGPHPHTQGVEARRMRCPRLVEPLLHDGLQAPVDAETTQTLGEPHPGETEVETRRQERLGVAGGVVIGEQPLGQRLDPGAVIGHGASATGSAMLPQPCCLQSLVSAVRSAASRSVSPQRNPSAIRRAGTTR